MGKNPRESAKTAKHRLRSGLTPPWTRAPTRGLGDRLTHAVSRPSASVPSAWLGFSSSPRCSGIQRRPMALLLALLHGGFGEATRASTCMPNAPARCRRAVRGTPGDLSVPSAQLAVPHARAVITRRLPCPIAIASAGRRDPTPMPAGRWPRPARAAATVPIRICTRVPARSGAAGGGAAGAAATPGRIRLLPWRLGPARQLTASWWLDGPGVRS